MKIEAQIRLEPNGKWHRRVGNSTQCGEATLGAFTSRDAVPDDNLCESCYTPRERLLVLADKIQRANDLAAEAELEDAPTDVDEAQDDFDDEEPTDVR